jgi:hypothetical protein
MDIDQYSAHIDSQEEQTAANMAALAEWAENSALPWLWDEMGGAILEPKHKHARAKTAPPRPSLRAMSDAEAVRQGLLISVADRKTKIADPTFYQAQMTMMDAEVKRHCAVIHRWGAGPQQPPPVPAVHTLHRALVEHLKYARILLEQAGACVAGVPGYYRAWRTPFDSAFQVGHAARQIIYGTYSGMAFADRAPSVPVAVLRTTIELRLREALDVWGLVNAADDTDVVPIDLSTLFRAVAAKQQSIKFAVDIHDVWKIYRWSNHYLHAGLRDFPWVVGFLWHYIWPFLAGQQKDLSINAGVQMTEDTWRSVRESLVPKPHTMHERIKEAWRVLFPQQRARKLILPDSDWKAAGCTSFSSSIKQSPPRPASPATP